MLETLRKQVYAANMELPARGLVTYTWGNVSGIDRATGLVLIKPSGVPYEELTPANLVVVNLENGAVVEGELRPSSDVATHLELYRQLPKLGGVVHTHSTWATIFAQAGLEIPALGTTHADYFYGPVPCTRPLTEQEVAENYELNTGKVICETLHNLDAAKKLAAAKSASAKNLAAAKVAAPTPAAFYEFVPAILVAGHGPFTWGQDAAEAVYHAVVLEAVAQMAYHTLQLNPEAALPQYVLEKHFERKHGPHAYYGQKK
jgi:L-ribulose-5-phosphate 4-epimerase